MTAKIEAVALKDEELKIVAGGDGLLDTLARGGAAVGSFFGNIGDFFSRNVKVAEAGEPRRRIIRPV